MNSLRHTITIETRIDADQVAVLGTAMHAIAAQFQRAKFSMIAAKNRKETINKPQFQRKHGLSSRQFNSVKGEVDGLFQSQATNMQRYVTEAEASYPQSARNLKSINKKLKMHGKSEKTLTDK